MSSYDNMLKPAGLLSWGNGAFYLYVLRDPDTMEIRYVGATRNAQGPLARYTGHVFEGGEAKMKWIRGLQSEGKLPVIHVLGVFSAVDAKHIERRYIRRLQVSGHKLLNHDGMLANPSYRVPA